MSPARTDYLPPPERYRCDQISAEVSTLVLGGDAALGLRYGADPDPGLVSVIIHHERLVPVCPPGHPLAVGGTDLAAALSGQRWLAFPPRPGEPSDPYAAALQQLLAAHGLGTAEVLPIDSLTAQKRMTEEGFGLAILPESSLDEELRTGTLRAIDAPALTATIPVALIRRRNAFQTGAARALTAALTDWPHGRTGGAGEAPRLVPDNSHQNRSRTGQLKRAGCRGTDSFRALSGSSWL
jgi:DNA-binding transcriptional LysR family regulator